MFPITKLMRSVGRCLGGDGADYAWLSGLPKEFAIWLVNECVYVKRGKCKSTAHGFFRYSIYPVFVVGSELTSIRGFINNY